MRFFSQFLNVLGLASSRPIQEAGGDSLEIPSFILPNMELCDSFTMPSLFAAQGDSQSGVFSLTHVVANAAASLVPVATLAKGYYEITIFSNYSSNYNGTSYGVSGARDHAVMIGNPGGNLTRDFLQTHALVNGSSSKTVNFRALLIEPGFQIFSRLETNGVGQTHSATVTLLLRRLLS